MDQSGTQEIIGGRVAVSRFIYGDLIPDLLSAGSPGIVNLQRRFSAYLRKSGQSALAAEENAEKWFETLRIRLEAELLSWVRRGLPRPASLGADQRTLVTWQHPDYEVLTGLPTLGSAFVEILHWLRQLDSRQFLIPSAVFLAHLGASRIYITDSSGDEGIDLVGTIETGPLKSAGLFVQAKTTSRRGGVTRDSVLLEYAKYVSLPHTEKYRQYIRTLGIDSTIDGSTMIYAITANTRFNNPAREVAARLGILLRSDIQLARYVQLKYGTIESVEKMHERLEPRLRMDLVTNVARFL